MFKFLFFDSASLCPFIADKKYYLQSYSTKQILLYAEA
jgi:hypothetical protein